MNIPTDENGKYICPHNNECRCTTLDCDTCGWEPDVAKSRFEKLRQRFKGVKYNPLVEQKFKIPFTGYCEVYAKTPEEALEKADDGDMYYLEYDFGEPDVVEVVE